jgi:hypothetical protein
MRHDMRKKARPRLEPIELIEIVIRTDCRKVDDLVEAVLEARRLGVKEDETHWPTPV